MRTYIAVTGVLFLLLTLAHAWRLIVERTIVADPWFITSTLVSIGMWVWAIRLLRLRTDQLRT